MSWADWQRFQSTRQHTGEKPADAPRFYADISHELRTPLAVLRGELEAFRMVCVNSRRRRWLLYRQKSYTDKTG